MRSKANPALNAKTVLGTSEIDLTKTYPLKITLTK